MGTRTEPRWSHQCRLHDTTKDLPIFAVFWEQGAAKTRPMIDLAAYLYQEGRCDTLIIVSDNGVHSNWVLDEIPSWMPDEIPWLGFEYHSTKAGNKSHQQALDKAVAFRGLAVVAFSWEGAISEKGKIALWRLLKRKALMIADETSAIKTPSADRTKTLIKAAQYAKVRRILNGTPIDNSPLDLYSQIMFLDPGFWMRKFSIDNFTSFKAYFAVYQKVDLYQWNPETHTREPSGRTYPQLLAYKNLDKLKESIAEISDRVLKDDVLDLPPKVFQWHYLEMSAEQQRLYRRLKEQSMVDVGVMAECQHCHGSGQVTYGEDDQDCPVCWGGGQVAPGLMTAELPIVKLLRLQQILCGYVQADGEPMEDIAGPNPRLNALERILEGGGPFVIWSRFQRDVDKVEALCTKLGLRVGTYDGRTRPDERTRVRQAFQAGELDVFNGNPAACAKGITLTKANHVVYYSNSFRLIFRLQSEDRVHRGGLDHKVTYTDLAIPNTVDIHIIKNLRNKQDVARLVTGDKLRQWLM